MASKDQQGKGKEHAKGSDSKEGAADLRWIGLESMRPTQCSVGMLEVELKMAELSERAKKLGCLEKYLQTHPIPAVMGPDAKMYLTDHHHMGLALMRLERQWDKGDRPAALNPFRRCCFQILKDFSQDHELCMGKFFAKMESHALCHPYAGDGSRAAEIPESLMELQDDPYRSLAGLARKAGAYDKVDVPFTEFKWADYFRDKVSKELVQKATLAQAIFQAVALANEPRAKSLPGYKGPRSAKDLPTVEEINARLCSRHGAEDASPDLAPLPEEAKSKKAH